MKHYFVAYNLICNPVFTPVVHNIVLSGIHPIRWAADNPYHSLGIDAVPILLWWTEITEGEADMGASWCGREYAGAVSE